MNLRAPDAVVIGDGIIGLSTAYELARAGITCCLVGARHDGAASGAAAGLLAPSVGHLAADVADFFSASLDLYPPLIAALQEFDPDLRLLRGLIEVSVWESEAARPLPRGATKLLPEDLAALEPSIDATRGGILHGRDGAVDNVRLVVALRAAIEREPLLRLIANDAVVRVDPGSSASTVTLASGEQITAPNIVIAAGAWSTQLPGLPRSLPVSPLKGQMLALDSRALTHPVMGDDIYLVPRGRELAVGATVEEAGFDISTTDSARQQLHRAAVRLVPALEHAVVTRTWSGIRPATPDRLPIIGRDPYCSSLIYACGHTKNGILLAPVTAQIVVGLVKAEPSPWNADRFAVDRF